MKVLNDSSCVYAYFFIFAHCFNSASIQIVNDHIFKAVYLPNHLTSTVISIINLIHQVVVCECEDLRYSMDEAVYHFVRVSTISKPASIVYQYCASSVLLL